MSGTGGNYAWDGKLRFCKPKTKKDSCAEILDKVFRDREEQLGLVPLRNMHKGEKVGLQIPPGPMGVNLLTSQSQ